MAEHKWITRWGRTVKSPAVTTGVMELKAGGYLLFGKVKGKHKERVLHEGSLKDAIRERLRMLDEAASPPPVTESTRPLFASYATSLLQRKITLKKIKSAAGIEKWKDTLENHLNPVFGRLPVDAPGWRAEIEKWKLFVQTTLIDTGKYAPTTCNGWLASVLFVVIRAAVVEFHLPVDPTMGVEMFDTSEHVTYTPESPNSLPPTLVRTFLRFICKKFPQHYAMVLLGFMTGLRPSSLRPLRRQGEEADVDWKAGVLQVRRSNSRGQHIMNLTKQGTRYAIGLPPDLMRELRLHVKTLEGVRADSSCELLFPSRGRGGGNTKAVFDAKPGMMSRSALDVPFASACAAMKLGYPVTPRGMRRTFQDLCRRALVEEDVQQFICGHATEDVGEREKHKGSRMTRKVYPTYLPEETAAAIGKLMRFVFGSSVKAQRPAKAKATKKAA